MIMKTELMQRESV